MVFYGHFSIQLQKMSVRILNVINQNKEDCRGKLSIQIGDKVYTIERIAKKYTKRLKGEETQEAKTDLNFEVFDPITGRICFFKWPHTHSN